MSCLLSLLLITCVGVSMVVAIPSESHQIIIAKHITAARHSFRTMQTNTDTDTSTSAPTNSMFGPVTGVSDECKATSVSLEKNNAIFAANASVIVAGCVHPNKEQSCMTRTCTCITTYSNDANLRSLVIEAGGQVCSLNLQFTASGNMGNMQFNYQGMGGLSIVGNACTNDDIMATLSYGLDIIAQGIRNSSANQIQSINGTMSFCGITYTGERSTTGENSNTQSSTSESSSSSSSSSSSPSSPSSPSSTGIVFPSNPPSTSTGSPFTPSDTSSTSSTIHVSISLSIMTVMMTILSIAMF